MPQIPEDQADKFFDDFEFRLVTAGYGALSRVAHLAESIAIENSSGPYGANELRRMDHPYATRHAVSKLPAGILNIGDGKGGDHVRDHWKTASPGEHIPPSALMLGPTMASEGYTVYNDSPIADLYLEKGTRFMFRRPVDRETMVEVTPMMDPILASVMKEFEAN